MASARSVYRCTDCGAEQPKWGGRCEACGAWNTLVEEPLGRTGGRAHRTASPPSARPPVRLSALGEGAGVRRWQTGLREVDFVLGRGIVPGNVGQVRDCAARLMRFAKEAGPAVLLVGHVTKGGGIAGPKTLEHIVDTVLYFEGESTLDHRILRAVKNRFGSVDEIGVFEMTGAGLEPVADPAAAFLAGRTTGVSGSAVTALMEG